MDTIVTVKLTGIQETREVANALERIAASLRKASPIVPIEGMMLVSKGTGETVEIKHAPTAEAKATVAKLNPWAAA